MNEVENKEIEEIKQIFADNGWEDTNDSEEIDILAHDIINAGYHRTVWHKVADGDLPDYCKLVIVVVKDDITNRNVITSSSRHDSDFGDTWWLGEYQGCEVIAWTELPIYEKN